jgi:hypothetical protein
LAVLIRAQVSGANPRRLRSRAQAR